MKQGDKLVLDIIDYGSNGEGIAKQDGFVVFVPFSLVGERVKARITYAKKSFATAVIEEILVKSPKRIEPPCNRFEKCGGCDILHIAYDEQLRLKKKAVENTFSKNYKHPFVIDECVPSDYVLGYRNKVSLPFGIVNDRVAVGFYREGTHKIVSITKCFLQGEWIENIIKAVLEYANDLKLSVYDETTSKGLLKHLVTRKSGEYYMITMVATDFLPKKELLINKLNEYIGNNYTLYLNINKGRGNTILNGDIKLLKGTPQTVKIRDIDLEINPFSFLQVNDNIRDKIYDRVIDIVKAKNACAVIDAYAGVGILGGNLAKSGLRVYNIEIVKEAVQDALKLAENNAIQDYVTSICGDSAVILPDLVKTVKADYNKLAVHSMNLLTPYFNLIKQGKKKYELRLNDEKRQAVKVGDTICFNSPEGEQIVVRVKNKFIYQDFEELFEDLGTTDSGFTESLNPNEAAQTMLEIYSQERINQYGALAIEIELINPELLVLLDPPRKGCDEKVLNAIKSSKVNSIIYISCNPATLSRDLELLSSDYDIEFITPYDMFPNTRHVESVVCLTRRLDN